MNYLQSKNALHDFASAIKASQNADEFRKNWNEYLLANAADPAYTETINIEEGSESAFIPSAVVGMINDIYDRNAGILKKLHYTGAKRFQVRHNISSQDRESSRAKGWTKKTKKAVEELDFAAKLIDNQVIYKIACIDIKTRFDSDEALIQYVIGELVDQMLYEIKRCLFHPEGDGRQDGDPYKITSIENLYNAETIGNGEYATVTNFNADFLVDDVRTMVDTVFNPNGKETALVMSKSAFRTLSRIQASETSTPVYLPMAQVAEQCGVTEIVLCDFLSDNDMICFIPSEIYVVGENILNPILYTWHEGLENADYWRYESFVGMGVNQMKSVGILKAGH